MKVVARYNFNGGLEAVMSNYLPELEEIYHIIQGVDASVCKTKISKEITMPGKMLYSPKDFNEAFKHGFGNLNSGWAPYRIKCDYTKCGEYLKGYQAPKTSSGHSAFRDMDFVKNGKKLGVEVQFGKYAFMVYNVCGKMTIFKNQGIINTGIEIVPVKNLADNMSTGVSYYEQFAWDLTQRGISDIDVPVLILGIDV